MTSAGAQMGYDDLLGATLNGKKMSPDFGGPDALQSECMKLCEENDLLKRCIRLMRDNSTLECATLLSAVISFCDGKFKKKFADGMGGGVAPRTGLKGAAEQQQAMGGEHAPYCPLYVPSPPVRDTPSTRKKGKKAARRRRASSHRGRRMRASAGLKTAKYQSFKMTSSPESQHLKSHVVTRTPVKSDLEYDPLYLKSEKSKHCYYHKMMQGDTVIDPPLVFPYKPDSTGTIVKKICNVSPGIIYHSSKTMNHASTDALDMERANRISPADSRNKGKYSSHQCYEKKPTPIVPFSREGKRMPTRKVQFDKLRCTCEKKKRGKKVRPEASGQEPEDDEKDPGYDYKNVISPILEQARQSLGAVTGVPIVPDTQAVSSYMVRHEHTDTTYLPGGTAKVQKDTHHKSFNWADEEAEKVAGYEAPPIEGDSEGEHSSSQDASASSPGRSASDQDEGGPQATSSEDYTNKTTRQSKTLGEASPTASGRGSGSNRSEEVAGEPDPDRQSNEDRERYEQNANNQRQRYEQDTNNQRISPFPFSKRMGDPSLGYFGNIAQMESKFPMEQWASDTTWDNTEASSYQQSDGYSEPERESSSETPVAERQLFQAPASSPMETLRGPMANPRKLPMEATNNAMSLMVQELGGQSPMASAGRSSRSSYRSTTPPTKDVPSDHRIPSPFETKDGRSSFETKDASSSYETKDSSSEHRIRSPFQEKDLHLERRARSPYGIKDLGSEHRIHNPYGSKDVPSEHRIRSPYAGGDLEGLEEIGGSLRRTPLDKMSEGGEVERSISYCDSIMIPGSHSSPLRCEGPHQYQNLIPAALASAGRNLLGEVAFQLERRILDYVFAKCLPEADFESSGGARRRRFYGYTVYNIGEMINREALAGTHYSRGTERMLRERLLTVLDILMPLGYDLTDHGRFSQDTINKYGLLSQPPAAKPGDVETEVGVPGVTVEDVQNFIVNMTDSEYEGQNLLLLFDCLRMLAIEDGRQLFVW